MDAVRDVELYQGLEPILGPQVTTALMHRLLPEPADELATKTDLGHVRGEMAGEFKAVRGEIAAESKALRTEMAAEFKAVRLEISGLSESLRLEMTAMKHELVATMRGEMIAAIASQGRQLAMTLAGSLVGLSVLAFAIANLAR